MRHRMIVLLMVIPLAASLSSGQQVAKVVPLPELLEKAIFTEETVGDLDAAIGLYREIIAQAEASKPVVAEARFRLGMCYVKQGKTDDAVESLRRLIADFPDQEMLVEQARARLVELGIVLPGGRLMLRQVWAPATDILGSPSPDGRYLSFTDWSTGDLAVHDFTTGQDRRLTDKGGWEEVSFAEYSVISRDGKQVAYAWFGNDFSYGLRVGNLEDFEPRVLHGSPQTPWIRPADWSPDGQHVLAWFGNPDRSLRLVTVSVKDGSVRELGSIAGGGDKAVFSPNGRYVAYSQEQSVNDRGKHDVFLVPSDGGSPSTLVEHSANDLVLGWSPDGRRILFASDRIGRWGLWAMEVTDGAPQGPAKLLLSELEDAERFQPMGFTSDGAYYYGVHAKMRNVYLADIDPATGEISDSPTKATQLFEGSNRSPAWSRDGKQLAFVSRRDDAFVIVIRTLESGEDREITVSPELLLVDQLQWSRDGGSFLVVGRDGPERDGLFLIDARSGAVSVLMRNDAELRYVARARWSPDGEVIYFQRHGTDGILAYDVASKREKVLFKGHVGALDLSPDGQRLAFLSVDLSDPGDMKPKRVFVLPAAGGEPKEIFRWLSRGGQVPLAWAPDGHHLILGKKDESRRPLPHEQPDIELWSLSIEGGEPRKLGFGMPGLSSVRAHPDGKRLALYAREQTVEVWVMENFLPELHAKR